MSKTNAHSSYVSKCGLIVFDVFLLGWEVDWSWAREEVGCVHLFQFTNARKTSVYRADRFPKPPSLFFMSCANVLDLEWDAGCVAEDMYQSVR